MGGLPAFSAPLLRQSPSLPTENGVVPHFLCPLCPAAAFFDVLLRNRDFEHGPKASDLRGTEVIRKYAIPKWETTGFVEYIKSGQKQGDKLLVVPEGAYAVRLGNEASIKQRIKVLKGMYYSLDHIQRGSVPSKGDL